VKWQQYVTLCLGYSSSYTYNPLNDKILPVQTRWKIEAVKWHLPFSIVLPTGSYPRSLQCTRSCIILLPGTTPQTEATLEALQLTDEKGCELITSCGRGN
jgi:hypothetical protein